MKKEISVCGADCSKCYCFGAQMCKGCNEHKGIVFHCDGKECAIYHCCKTEHSFASCLECKSLPCEIWNKTRDPKFTDEEFAESIRTRIETLKANA